MAELPQWPMKIPALAFAALGFMPELAFLGIGIWLLTIGWTVTGGALVGVAVVLDLLFRRLGQLLKRWAREADESLS